MKRRDFLKSSVIGSVLAGLPHNYSRAEEESVLRQYQNTSKDIELLQHSENEYLSYKLYSDASTQIYDKVNQMEWFMGPVAVQERGPIEEGHVWMRSGRTHMEEYPARFIGEKLSNGKIQFTMLQWGDRVMGQFICAINIEGSELVYRIEHIDERIPSLIFPQPVTCDSLIIPLKEGKWYHEENMPQGSIYDRKIWQMYGKLTMPWFGGIKENHAWICLFDEGLENAAAWAGNRQASPVWMKSLDKWTPSREVRYAFLEGNYVQLAKYYRKWFQKRQPTLTLNEKAEQTPSLRNLFGGRTYWVHHSHAPLQQKIRENGLYQDANMLRRVADKPIVEQTYQDSIQKLKELRSLGATKGLYKVAGWINGGYDYSHPDIWPPEPSLGSIAELKELLASGEDFVMALHDNYMDIYEQTPSYPEGIVHNADGSYMFGGVWGGGQAFIMHYKKSIEYAKRNWQKMKQLEPAALFPDTITAMGLFQSFEPGNTMTRAEDLHYKQKTMQFFKKQGMLVGGEENADFGVPYLDWLETRHERIQGESIPLWSLVHHESVLTSTYRSNPDKDLSYPRYMQNMLWGYMMHFFIGKNSPKKEYFQESMVADQWHEQIAAAEMTNHSFLTDDMQVERTEWSTGQSITCNFSNQAVTLEGITIPANHYKIQT